MKRPAVDDSETEIRPLRAHSVADISSASRTASSVRADLASTELIQHQQTAAL
jgi:hypothetical protein